MIECYVEGCDKEATHRCLIEVWKYGEKDFYYCDEHTKSHCDKWCYEKETLQKDGNDKS